MMRLTRPVITPSALRIRRSSTWTVAVVTAGLVASGLAAARAAEPAPAGATAPVLPKTVDGRVGDWVGESSMIGGTTQLSLGELVYQDHVFDDGGPETRQRSTQRAAVESRVEGDYRYPTDEARYAHNAADILEVRVAADAATVWVLVRLNTLLQPDTTVVAVGIDNDGSSGGGEWPYGSGVRTAGSDVVVTVHAREGGDGHVAVLTDPSGQVVAELPVAVGLEDNAVELAVPRSLVPGDVWTIHAATGLWNAATGEWMAARTAQGPSDTEPGFGSPLVSARAFNVAFRPDEFGAYFEADQAAVLAGGDISKFAQRVDLAALADGTTEPFTPAPGRFYAAIVEESFTIPPLHEGMSFDGVPGRGQGLAGAALTQSFNFFGRHQPYGVYLPRDYDGTVPLPTVLVLHGHGGGHAGFNSDPAFLEQMGEELGPTMLVSPLGRGSSMYSDYGERDVLEVLDDAFARFAIDPERLYLAGYSMGGHGVYRLGTLYPDRFAAGVSWAGYTGEFTGTYLNYADLTGDPGNVSRDVWEPNGQPVVSAVLGGDAESRGKVPTGNPVDIVENLRYLPVVHLAGTNDEILPVTGQYAAARRLEQLGYRHRFDLYPGYEHFSFALVKDWRSSRLWLGDQQRETTPRHVTYKFSEAFTDPDLLVDLDLRHGHAWWLGSLRQRDHADIVTRYAMADLTSHALAEPQLTAEVVTEPVATPTPHVRRGIEWVDPATDAPVENRLTAVLQNARLVEIDAAGAALDPARALVVDGTTDGPVTIVLHGSFAGVLVTGGPGVVAKATGKALVIEITADGDTVFRVDAAPRRLR